MRRWIVPLVLVLVGLAGCLGGDQADGVPGVGPGDPGSAERSVIPWDLHDCTALVWFIPADGQALADQLPPGFTPRPVIGLPAGDPLPGVDAYLGFEAFTCEQGAGLEGPVEPMTYATVFTSVDPPSELAVDGVDGQHYYKWHVLVPDASRRAVLQAAGLPVLDGSVSLGEPAPGLWSATVDLDGLGTFTLEGLVDGDPQPNEASIPFAEFTPATDGWATWRATATEISRAGGAGTWTVAEGSWMADVLGSDQGVASFDLDLWSFVDATVTLPSDL